MINDDVITTGEEIMECDMEIEDESPEASIVEEATPPREQSSTAISVAPPIVDDLSEGQKVNQALPPTTREAVEEDDEPLPPGVEDDEPLPPGIEAASGSRGSPPSGVNIAGEAGVVSQESGKTEKIAEQPGKWVVACSQGFYDPKFSARVFVIIES
jgi:hypothetical protein